MKKVNGFFETIGTFESYSGDVLTIDCNIIIPMFNVQLDEDHPLNKYNKIMIVDYCFFAFKKVSLSSRLTCPSNNEKMIFQINWQNNNIDKDNKEFIIETIDVKNHEYTYWDWKIKAQEFILLLPDDFQLNERCWDIKKIDIRKFQQIDLQYLSYIFN